MTTAISLRRHAWLRSATILADARRAIEDLPFDGSGLFDGKLDDILGELQKMCRTACSYSYQSNFRPYKPYWRKPCHYQSFWPQPDKRHFQQQPQRSTYHNLSFCQKPRLPFCFPDKRKKQHLWLHSVFKSSTASHPFFPLPPHLDCHHYELFGPKHYSHRLRHRVNLSSPHWYLQFHRPYPRTHGRNPLSPAKKQRYHISDDPTPGLYSRYFTVPKKDGGLKTYTHLRQLHFFISPQWFRMSTLENVVPLLHP